MCVSASLRDTPWVILRRESDSPRDSPQIYYTIYYYILYYYYTIIYYTMLYYTILYYTILYYTSWVILRRENDSLRNSPQN